MTGRYLEDFAVGQTFRSGRLRIDRERIKTFAAEFDPQPFHLDEDAARNTIFGGLAASGWHTAAVTMRLLVESDLKPSGGIVGAGALLGILLVTCFSEVPLRSVAAPPSISQPASVQCPLWYWIHGDALIFAPARICEERMRSRGDRP